MKRVLLVLLMVGLFMVTACEDESPSDPTPPSGTSYMAVVMDDGMQIMDGESQQWVGSTLGLGTAPNDIVVDEQTIYVINSTSCDLQEFELEAHGWTYTRRLDLGLAQNRNPYNAALTGRGSLLVTNLLDNSVSVVNLFDWQVDTLWDTGMTPEGVLVHGDRAYIVNTGYDFQTFTFHPGSVYVYDVPTGELVDSLTVGINAQYIAMLQTGELVVSCTGDYGNNPGEIWILERDPLELVSQVEVEGSPGRVRVSPDGWLFCAAGGWSLDGESEGLVLRWASILDNPQPELVGTALGTIDIAPQFDGSFYVAAREGQSIQYFEGDSLVQTFTLPDSPVVLSTLIL